MTSDKMEWHDTMITWTCNAGSFIGFEKDGCAHATGIRYAMSKRWEPPIPYVYDAGVHECTSPAPFAVQLPSCMGLSAQEVLEAGAPFRKEWADFAKTGKVERTSLDGMVEIRELGVSFEIA